MTINRTSNTPERNFPHCKSRICQHTVIENNKDVILCTVPWQLLSCHYTIMKSFPCLTWKHIIMIKNNSEMSINAMPLLPHFLSLRYPQAPVSFFWPFSTAILMHSWWGGALFHAIPKIGFLELILLECGKIEKSFINLSRRRWRLWKEIKWKHGVWVL